MLAQQLMYSPELLSDNEEYPLKYHLLKLISSGKAQCKHSIPCGHRLKKTALLI